MESEEAMLVLKKSEGCCEEREGEVERVSDRSELMLSPASLYLQANDRIVLPFLFSIAKEYFLFECDVECMC